MRKKKIIIGVILLLLLGMLFYMENNMIEITDYDYVSADIPTAFEGYRIVQISDLHNKSFGKNSEHLLSKVEACEPDIIVITGDLVDSNHTDIGCAVEFVQKALKVAPVYYITGNHEKWLDAEQFEGLMDGLKQSGVTVLDDAYVRLTKEGQSFAMIGLDDSHLRDETIFKIRELISDEWVLLLTHDPQNLEHYAEADIDLVLSGHAHGGQIRLPFVGGMIAPDQGIFPTYTAGIHRLGKTRMIISRGLGNSIIPIRLGNRPEVVCVELHCKEKN